MIDVDLFDDEQRKFLSMLVSDFHGPTSTGSLLSILEQVLYYQNPEFELSSIKDESLQKDVAVCLAASTYGKVKDIASS